MRMRENLAVEHDESRRRFCKIGLAGISVGIGMTMLGAGGVFLGAPAITNRAKGQWIEVGSIEDFEDGQFTQVVLEFSIQDGWAYSQQRMLAYVSRKGDELKALSATCTHLGCNVRYDEEGNRFICPCHAGVYDPEGKNIAGPPPKPLSLLPVKIEKNTVLVYNKNNEDEANA